MQDVHARIFAWKRANPGGADPVPPLADASRRGAALLCFDEFQINDIADAMILGRLFAALFERAVVVVATSNTTPDDLFRGKPGRDAFLPFIELIKRHLDVLVLEGGRDFRRARLRGQPTWHVPPNGRADAALDRAFARPVGRRHAQGGAAERRRAHPARAAGGAKGGAVRLRGAVRPAARPGRLPGARHALRRAGAGRHPAPRARRTTTRRGGSSPWWTRCMSTGSSWWPPRTPSRTSCTSAARGPRRSSARRPGWRRCRAEEWLGLQHLT